MKQEKLKQLEPLFRIYMKQEKLKQLEPLSILLVTYKRLWFLKPIVKAIYENTKYPYKLFVINNAFDDKETIVWLKQAKAQGYLYDFISMPKNKGLAWGFTSGFNYWRKNFGKYLVCTQDDVRPPNLMPCWAERLLHLFKKYEDTHVAISLRTQRIRRRDVDEHKELIPSPTSLASYFRISKTEDIDKIGGFGAREHWESVSFKNRVQPLKKKTAVATHLYCSDEAYMSKNKGYAKGFTDYKTFSIERINQGELQPYPDIESKSLMPIKINTPRDRAEQARRDAYYKSFGLDGKKKHLTLEQKELAKYCGKGIVLDLGCGWNKCHANAIGIDIYSYPSVDILHNVQDLWMFKNESVDTVVNSHTLEHMPDGVEVLKEWKRVLKRGGILGIAVPDFCRRPRYILKQGHRFPVSLDILKLIFRYKVRMKIIRAEYVKGKKEGQYVALIVVRKR